ncbi:hypothetical protein [Terriglobus sp. RCC_193]|uniref:hypothetical protein n=1 Tax=Terriglobus sp. RCC_193 TaxID=3239218 RepID=UPI003526046D
MDVSAFALSHLLSDLVGRKVQVVEADFEGDTKASSVGTYAVQPEGSTIVMKIDTLLLGSLGGALAGLPEALVKQQVSSGIDEMLRDAMHEILNVTSSALTTEGRAVLKSMMTEKPQVDAASREAFGRSHTRVYYSATISGYPGGSIALYAFG